MNGRSSSGDQTWPLAALLVGIFLYGVWQFSQFANVDFATGFWMVVYFGVWGVVLGASVIFGRYSIFDIRGTWPIFLAFAWAGLWPALDFWAHQSIPSFLDASEYLPWWDRWYTKAGGFAALLFGGYAIKNWLD